MLFLYVYFFSQWLADFEKHWESSAPDNTRGSAGRARQVPSGGQIKADLYFFFNE
jgi:hypothetical protein